jgi:DNA-binding response OmpR family regulator
MSAGCVERSAVPASPLACGPVLVVSREFDTQDLCVRILRSERIAALSTDSAADAIAIGRRSAISSVLFDVEYPDDWNGIDELCRQLPPTVPVVVLTGWVRGDGANRALARRLGCAGFLAKPIPPPLMVEAMRRVASGSTWIEYL